MPSKHTAVPVEFTQDSIMLEVVDDLLDTTSPTAVEPEPDTATPSEEFELAAPVPSLEDVMPAQLAPAIGTAMPAAFDIADLIMDIDDDLEWLTILAYGRNGVGKTMFGASGGEGTLVIDADVGTRSAAGSGGKKLKPRTFADFEAIYWMLKNGTPTPEGIVINLKGAPYLVRVLVLDTLTKLQALCLRAVVLKEAQTDASKDVVNPTLRDFGIMSQKMQYWLTAIKALPVHKIWLCQERTSSDDLDVAGFSGFPDLSKSLRNYVCGEADIIGRMYIKQVNDMSIQYRMLVGGNETYVTKDRTSKLGYALANPKFPSLYKLVYDRNFR